MLATAVGALLAGMAPVIAVPLEPVTGPIDKRGYRLFDPTPRAAMRDFTTDRPDTTESPFAVDAGHFQVELSLAGYSFDRDGPARILTIDALPVNLKLGLTNAVDIQFVFTPYRRVVTSDGAAREVTRGFAAGRRSR